MMEKLLEKQKNFFRSNQTKEYAFRKRQLVRLKEMIINHQKEIEEALYLDLHKSPYEAYSTEIGFCLHSISKALKKLKKWMKPRRVSTPIHLVFTKSYVMYEPIGTVFIMGPYNYPFQLVIEPLIGAMVAGNTAIIKPSEFASHTEQLLYRLVNDTFEKEYIHCVTGGKEVANELIHLPFDHIFFTGSTRVGQIVYQAASNNLVPVTLELGGKSPAIVDQTVPLKIVARRIVFGKFINAGQTCIAPDYIYIHQDVKDEFIRELIKTIDDFYPTIDENYAKIINHHHYDRLSSLVDEEKLVYGYKKDAKNLKIGPTILDNVTWDDGVMKEEIFGPVLPILTYQDIDEMIGEVKKRDKPLALYLFTKDKNLERKVFSELSFGGGAINDTIMHIVNPKLPFGGVGASGIGDYHGKASFIRFSNRKSYMRKGTLIDIPIAYPPYTNFKEKLVRHFFK